MEYEFESVVRGYHIYQRIWGALVGEILYCAREVDNPTDRFAVCIKRDEIIVGHVPRKFSALCSVFLRNGGNLACKITGRRQYSGDLPQGGLEIPCVYIFQGAEDDIIKVKKCISVSFPTEFNMDSILAKSPDSCITEPPEKRRKIDRVSSHSSRKWLQLDSIYVTEEEKDIISSGGLLNDKIIDFAQALLVRQFCSSTLCGLQSSLLQQSKNITPFPNDKPVLQIVHCEKRKHWIVITNIKIGGSCGYAKDVFVYDSLYTSIDFDTLSLLKKWFGVNVNVKLPSMQIQVGATDCGLFAIAVLVALLHNKDPSTIKFNQSLMRQHLISSFELNKFIMFP